MSGGDRYAPAAIGAVGGDVGIPCLAGGDHSLCLGRGELVGLPCGQVLVAGGVDGVAALGAPDRAPGGQAEGGSALAGEFGAADERGGQFLPRCETGVLDQGAGGGEPFRVVGFGQDCRGTDRRQAGDGGGQVGQLQLVEHAGHPGLGVGELVGSRVPVLQQERDPLQSSGPVGGHAGGVG